MSKYLRFEPLPTPPKKKTKRWLVVTKSSTLGQVAWYAQWRCYCFYPRVGTIFNTECLTDIATFCEKETREQRSTRGGRVTQ